MSNYPIFPFCSFYPISAISLDQFKNRCKLHLLTKAVDNLASTVCYRSSELKFFAFGKLTTRPLLTRKQAEK